MRKSTVAAVLASIASLFAGGAASARGLVPCAQEGGFCRLPYPTTVVYGVPGKSTSLEIGEAGVACSNDVFGDPAPGIRKQCAFVDRGVRRHRRGDWD